MHVELKQLRKENGVSQAFMALELGVSRPTYIAIEQGKRQLTFSELLKICVFFNCKVTLDKENYSLVFEQKPQRVIQNPNPVWQKKHFFQKMINKQKAKKQLLVTDSNLEWHEGGLEIRE